VGDDFLEAARCVRPYLTKLVPGRAATVDVRLAELLAAGSKGCDVDADIMRLLEEHPPVHDWAVDFLRHGAVPPDLSKVERTGAPDLPGLGEPLKLRRYACPEGDYVWWRRSVAHEPPPCPTHAVALVPADR
jgi:hypothetical protein